MNERETIDAAIAAWNERGVDAFLEFIAPDVEWHAPPGFLEGEVFHGRAALAPQMREQFGSVFKNSKTELRDAVEGPNGWLVAAHQTAEHGATKVEWQGWYVVHIDNGLLKRMWVFMDREPALQQAGLDG
jgi:hypothetical protein